MTDYTLIFNWACINLGCANCPYRRGDRCFEKEIKNGDVE